MKKILLISALILSLFLLSCGNDVTTGDDSDAVATQDEATDKEMSDDLSDVVLTESETTDEINDEVSDDVSDEVLTESEISDTESEVVDTETETSDEDSVQECKDLNVKYDQSGLDTAAENISLEVYSNGWGTLLDTLSMKSEGNIILEIDEENPYNGGTPSYFIYETAEGFFTDIAYADYGDTIDVDLDPIMPDQINGVIFMVQYYFGPSGLSNTDIAITKDGKSAGCFTTDNRGRFVIDLPYGDYVFNFQDMDQSFYSENVTVNSNYIELRISAEAQADKPNIYLYPEETIELDVTLDFPIGGFVTASIPEYGTGWNVTVESDGTIDEEYGFLFYESQNPDVFQYSKGWTVKSEGLEKFFTKNMALYGFEGREIDDFIEWWIPRLKDDSCYDIFPQTTKEIDPVIKVNFSINPDSFQRLYYAIKEYEKCNDHLAKPAIEPFERVGFSALEWGVVLR